MRSDERKQWEIKRIKRKMRNGAKHATGRQTERDRKGKRVHSSPGKVIINRFVVVFKLKLVRMGIPLCHVDEVNNLKSTKDERL